MKKVFLILIILFGQVRVTLSQDSVALNETLKFQSEAEREFWQLGKNDPFLLFRTVNAHDGESANIWEDLVEELDKKAYKSKQDIVFLRQIFEKTNQKLFKKYQTHSTFNGMLKEGNYDCVSGTAGLGILLTRYGYKFDIIETDYHVFILVDQNGKKIVLESTLPYGGMITIPVDVKKYIDSFTPNLGATPLSTNRELAGIDIEFGENSIFRKVSLNQLAGLQYYNDAIDLINKLDFTQAVDQLSKAYTLYPSERIQGLRELSIDLAYKTFGYELKK